MPSFPPGRSLRIALGVIGLAYPVLVYFGLRFASPAGVALGILALLALRSIVLPRKGGQRHLTVALWAAATGALVIVALSPLAALHAYPILVSLAFAAVFAYSLWRPPTIIEQIARLREPALPAVAVPYLRKVTLLWIGFFLANAALSAATAASGSLELWTLYNGFISYVLIGALFVGEWIFRGFLREAKRDAA
jgi:uncharacterized membrane protein